MIGAIIAEYNPLHNGHIYLIDEAKRIMREKSGDTDNHIIIIMSGNFCQRGEPALLNKYTRARHALLSGADMVIELPSIYATSSAEYFAKGGIDIASRIKGLDYIFCGAECESTDSLHKAVAMTSGEQYHTFIREYISQGHSYPRSSQLALERMGVKNCQDYSSPNNILAIEYIRQAMRYGMENKVVTVLRKGAGYHNLTTDGEYISASAIRQKVISNSLADIDNKLPQYVRNDLECAEIYYDRLYGVVCANALASTEVYEDNEGVLNRIKAAITSANSYEELINLSHTKRYTKGKIKRILLHLAMQYTPDDINIPLVALKVLGVRRESRQLLSLLNHGDNTWHIDKEKETNKIYNIISRDKILIDKMLVLP